jgi:spermidine synthase
MCKNWIVASLERSHPGQHILLGLESVLFKGHSAYQEVVIAEVPLWGRGLFLDSNVQLLAGDEFIYHEHLALLPLLYHPAPRRVLIIGGGDGLALREVLRDRRVEQVVLVDIDALVVEACREYLHDLHRHSFAHPKASIIIDDARHYLATGPLPFDVALVDLTDPEGATGLELYREVIALLKPSLTPRALVTVNGGAVDPPGYPALSVHVLLQQYFDQVVLHRAHIPSFAKEWGFLLASDYISFLDMTPDVLQKRRQHLAGDLRALTLECYPTAFCLPPYLTQALQYLRSAHPSTRHQYTPEFTWVYPPDP